MNNKNDWKITEAMIIFGGGFVSQLGKLFRLADRDNQLRLKLAFPEYWKSYTEIAELKIGKTK